MYPLLLQSVPIQLPYQIRMKINLAMLLHLLFSWNIQAGLRSPQYLAKTGKSLPWVGHKINLNTHEFRVIPPCGYQDLKYVSHVLTYILASFRKEKKNWELGFQRQNFYSSFIIGFSVASRAKSTSILNPAIGIFLQESCWSILAVEVHKKGTNLPITSLLTWKPYSVSRSVPQRIMCPLRH